MSVDTSTERRVVLHTDWAGYQKIAEAVGEAPAVRLTYSGGSLEIMTTSHEHERFKTLLASLLEAFMDEAGLTYEAGGADTFKRQELDKGFEPDECYWISNHQAMLGVKRWEAGIHPPPDVAMEVEITHGLVPRLPIYAALGIPEVWWFHDGLVEVLVLQEDGTHAVSPVSPSLALLDPDAVQRSMSLAGAQPTSAIVRGFRQQMRALLEAQPRGRHPQPPL